MIPSLSAQPASAPAKAKDLAPLVAAARTGDRAALEALVRSTYADSYALAYRLTGNDEDASDVVQEAYLRAYRGLRRFRGEAQFTTWLYRITANCASTVLSRRSRTRTEALSDDAVVPDVHPDHDPEGRAASEEDRMVVAEALARLPARLRQVIVLRDIYDLSHGSIATELDISEAAAKVRLHRARRKMREYLTEAPAVSERRRGPVDLIHAPPGSGDASSDEDDDARAG
ncbi:MAG: RNA polymerase sigma factor [Actinomycetota bacterium]|nr:RNA polymerase sigma factor [Actinomycetota bacterium]